MTGRSALRLQRVAAVALAAGLISACGGSDDDADQAAPSGTVTAPTNPAPNDVTTTTTTTTEPDDDAASTTEPNPFARPDWLGTEPLPLRPDGLGEIQPTPPELVDRQLEPSPHLEPPSDDSFHQNVEPVPEEVADRSTWQPDCPVELADLAYVTVSFWGFDGQHHTGELLVNESVAQDVVDVFAQLHDARFPIEELRITSPGELDAAPTGDGNVSGSFVCRPMVESSSWSEHAYGLAVDINPFHNPYVRDDVVIPELASAYVDRDDERPGMIAEGDVVARAFADIGWGWGGSWQSSKDWMHFSESGR